MRSALLLERNAPMIATLILSAATLVPAPTSYTIDSGSWPGAAETIVSGRVVAADGSVHTFFVEIQPNATLEGISESFCTAITGGGWRAKVLNPATVVVEGTATSPVRSVELKSEQWVPTVRPVFAPPPKP